MRTRPPGGIEPLSPQRKWRAIALATLLFAPACWLILTGYVAGSSDDADAPGAGAAFALGLALIPFVFVLLAFLSRHPRPPGAVARAMGLAVLVFVPVSAAASDGVTGLVAGVGAGGVVALRSEAAHDWRIRAAAVILAAAYVFVLVRLAGPVALMAAPVLPLTGIGVADHWAERRAATRAPSAT